MIEYPTKRKGRPSKRPERDELYMLYSGMTQNELAEHYGVAKVTIKRWLYDYHKQDKERIENGK